MALHVAFVLTAAPHYLVGRYNRLPACDWQGELWNKFHEPKALSQNGTGRGWDGTVPEGTGREGTGRRWAGLDGTGRGRLGRDWTGLQWDVNG